MNPHSKPRPLFFTPRSPWGRLPLKRAIKSHMRASEGERDLPEEDRDGRLQGEIESSGGAQGKPESSFKLQVNSNPTFRDTGRQSDFLGEGREKLNRERAQAKIQKEKEKQQRQSQKEVENYVTTSMSAIDDAAAFLKELQRQRRPER